MTPKIRPPSFRIMPTYRDSSPGDLVVGAHYCAWRPVKWRENPYKSHYTGVAEIKGGADFRPRTRLVPAGAQGGRTVCCFVGLFLARWRQPGCARPPAPGRLVLRRARPSGVKDRCEPAHRGTTWRCGTPHGHPPSWATISGGGGRGFGRATGAAPPAGGF